MHRRLAWPAALTAAAVSLAGAPVGLIWAALTPAPLAELSPDGPVFVNPEAKTFFSAEVYFLVIGLVVGVCCGLLARRLRALPALAALPGLAAGGAVASLVAARVGERVHHGAFAAALAHSPVGTQVAAAVSVRADGVLLAWPFAAVLVYGVLVALAPG